MTNITTTNTPLTRPSTLTHDPYAVIILPQAFLTVPYIPITTFLIAQLTSADHISYDVGFHNDYYIITWNFSPTNNKAFYALEAQCGFSKTTYLSNLSNFASFFDESPTLLNYTSDFTTLSIPLALYYLNTLNDLSTSSRDFNNISTTFFYFYYKCRRSGLQEVDITSNKLYLYSRSITDMARELGIHTNTLINHIRRLEAAHLIKIYDKKYRFNAKEGNYARTYQLVRIPKEDLKIFE